MIFVLFALVTVAAILRLILDDIRLDPSVCLYCAASVPEQNHRTLGKR
jgi:hypothetical protein